MGLLEPSKRTAIRQGSPPLCADLWRCPSHLSPEVLAPEGLCCPFLPRLATSSASLKTSPALPSMASYSGGLWHSRILLPGLHTFRTCTAVLSRIAICSFRRESGTCIPPFFRTSAGHRVEGRNPWHLQHSRNQLHAGTHVDGSFVRSRYGPPGCSPPGLIRPSESSVCLRLLRPGCQPPSHFADCRISLRRQMGNCADRTCTCKYNS